MDGHRPCLGRWQREGGGERQPAQRAAVDLQSLYAVEPGDGKKSRIGEWFTQWGRSEQ